MELEQTGVFLDINSSKIAKRKRGLLALLESFCNRDDIYNYVSFILKKLETEENIYLKIMCYHLLSSVDLRKIMIDEKIFLFFKGTLVKNLKNEKNKTVIEYILKLMNNFCNHLEYVEFFHQNYYPVIIEKLEEKKVKSASPVVRGKAQPPKKLVYNSKLKCLCLDSLTNFFNYSEYLLHPFFRNVVFDKNIVVKLFGEFSKTEQIFKLFQFLDSFVFLLNGKKRYFWLHSNYKGLKFFSKRQIDLIEFFSQYFDLLYHNLLKIELSNRTIGIRILTFILISFLKNDKIKSTIFIKEILIPLITKSTNYENKIEAGFCLFLISENSNSSSISGQNHSVSLNYFFNFIFKKYFKILKNFFVFNFRNNDEENEAIIKSNELIKELCFLLFFIKKSEKFFMGLKLLKFLAKIKSIKTRVYVEIIISKIILKKAVENRILKFKNNESIKGNFFGEFLKFMEKNSKFGKFDWNLKTEIFYTIFYQFFCLNPLKKKISADIGDADLLFIKSWLSIGLDLYKWGKECLLTTSSSYNCSKILFGKIIFLLLNKTVILTEITDQVQSKRLFLYIGDLVENFKDIIKDLFNSYGKLECKYSKLIVIYILSFYIFSFRSLSGENSIEIVIKNIFRLILKKDKLIGGKYFKGNKIEIEILSMCLFKICEKFPEKSDKIVSEFKKIFKNFNPVNREKSEIYNDLLFHFKKLDFFRKYNINPFHRVKSSSHNLVIFENSFYTQKDFLFKRTFLNSLYNIKELKFYLKNKNDKYYLKGEASSSEGGPVDKINFSKIGEIFLKPNFFFVKSKKKILSYSNDPILIVGKWDLVSEGIIFLEVKIKNICGFELKNIIVGITLSEEEIRDSKGEGESSVVRSDVLEKKNEKFLIKELKKDEKKVFFKKYLNFSFSEKKFKVFVKLRNNKISSKSLYIYISNFLRKPKNFTFFDRKQNFSNFLNICKFYHNFTVKFDKKEEIFKFINQKLRRKFKIISSTTSDISDNLEDIKKDMFNFCLITKTFNDNYLLLTILIDKFYVKENVYYYVSNFKFHSDEKKVINSIKNSRWLKRIFEKRNFKILSKKKKIYKSFEKLKSYNEEENDFDIFNNSNFNLRLDLKEHYGITDNVMNSFFNKKWEKVK